jgi:hypothetical protein
VNYVFIFIFNNSTESMDTMRTLCGLPMDTQSPQGQVGDYFLILTWKKEIS